MSTAKQAKIQPWLAWGIGVAFVVLVFGYQTGYAVIKGDVAGTHSLNAAQIGLIGAAYTWAFAIFQLISGSLLDRVGARRILPIAMILLALGIAGFATLSSLPLLILTQVVVAAGACFGFVGAGFVGGAWFGMAKYGLMFALVQFIASMSASVNQAAIVGALRRFNWDTLMLFMAGSGVVLFLLALLFLRDPAGWDETHGWPRHPRKFVGHVASDVGTVVTRPKMWSILVLGATSFSGMLAIGAVWGGDIAASSGLDDAASHAVLPWVWVGLALGAPSFAALSDRLHRRRPLLIASVVIQAVLIAFVISWTFESALVVGTLYFLFGFAAGGSMIPFTMAAELAGTALAGTSAALVNGIQFVGAGLLMLLPGYLQQGGFDTQASFYSIPAILALSLLAAFALPETFVEQPEDMGA